MNSREYSRYLFHYVQLPNQYLAPRHHPGGVSFFQIPPQPANEKYIMQPLGFYLNTLSVTLPNSTFVTDCFLELLNLQDEIILLILELTSIDLMFHQLTFTLSTDVSVEPHCFRLGSFSPSRRVVTMSVNELLLSTMIHEITHACGYFTFQRNASDALATTPHPSTDELNPAKLKFQHCAQEDRRRLQTANIEEYLFTPEIDKLFDNTFAAIQIYYFKTTLKNFFRYIESMYNGNIQDEVVLNEIFPFYIDTRAKLLKFSKDTKMPQKSALLPLERYLPKLHQYFETDIKRILQHRLYHATVFYHLEDYKSLVLPYLFNKTNPQGPVYRGDIVKVLRNHLVENLLKAATPAITLTQRFSR